MFSEKTLLITGGTGSFGNAVLRRFLSSDIGEIRILSRDEKKQDDMRRRYASSKLKFHLGDVRDPRSVATAMQGVDYCFHAAALKQVPSCEFYPVQAVMTNVLGTENVLTAARAAGVKRVICLSTDKAVYPINAMGISKAMMEKVMMATSREFEGSHTMTCVTRYGNVMASRGSVIPLFINQILSGQPITVTHPQMTRFMMTLDEAVDLVLYAFGQGNNGDILVQKAPAATLETLVQALLELFDRPNHEVKTIGIRHGEKMYESLMGREERARSQDLGDYFRVPADDRDLNYGKFFEEGNPSGHEVEEYSSGNAQQLDVEGLKTLLLKVDSVQRSLRGETALLED